MNMKSFGTMLVGLLAMTAFLAGCTSSPQGENQEQISDCEAAAAESKTTGRECLTTTTTTTTTSNPADLPSPPNLRYASPLEMEIKVYWERSVSNGSAPITAYKVYRSTSYDGPLELVEVFSTQTAHVLYASWNDLNVEPDGVYYYRMSAVNSYGESDPESGAMVWSSTYSLLDVQPVRGENGFSAINLASGGWSDPFWQVPESGDYLLSTFGKAYTICFYQDAGDYASSNDCEYHGQAELENMRNQRTGQAGWLWMNGEPGEYFRIRMDYPGVALISTCIFGTGSSCEIG